MGRARSEGIEVTSEVDVLPNLVASAQLHLHGQRRTCQTGRRLPREPRAPLERRRSPGSRIPKLSLFTQVHVESGQFEPFGEVYNSGYTRVDIGGTWRILERFGWLQKLELTARIQNLLNDSYAEVRGFPALGINALVGLRASF